MKATVKVKMLSSVELPTIIRHGEWIDLRAAADTIVGRTPVTYIPLGIAMRLPKGYEAILASRSSTPARLHIWNPSAIGVIDSTFCGDTDSWSFPAAPIGYPTVVVNKGDRICQFRIQLSQRATIWQRIKWLFTSGIRLKVVDTLNATPRGGLGSTGIK